MLQKIAKSLQISAETLYVQAGILSPDDHQIRQVEVAILGDPGLTARTAMDGWAHIWNAVFGWSPELLTQSDRRLSRDGRGSRPGDL